MSISRRVCLFCRKNSCQFIDECNCSSRYAPLFLTYLKTINVNCCADNNFPREEFHPCTECGSLLGMITELVQKLGQELQKIYNVTFENLNEDVGLRISEERNERLDNLRRQIVADKMEIKGFVAVRLKEEEDDPDLNPPSYLNAPFDIITAEDEVTVKMEIEEGEVKVEIGDEFILPHFGQDSLDDRLIERNYLVGEDEVDPLGLRPPKRFRLSSEEEHPPFGDISTTELKPVNEDSSPNEIGPKNEPPLGNETLYPVNVTSELKCDYCSVTTGSLAFMTRHLHSEHLGLIFPCHQPGCTARFANRDLLRLHRSGNHCLIKCDNCELTFTSAESLTQHKLEFHQKCGICGLAFLRSNFPYHVGKCREANEKSAQKAGSMDQELARVTKHIPPTGAVTSDCAEARVQNRRNHEGRLLFQCQHSGCTARFESHDLLRSHIAAGNHRKCPQCCIAFTSAEFLDQHKVKFHKTCGICGGDFPKSKFPHHVHKCMEINVKKAGSGDLESATKHVSNKGVVTYDCTRCNVRKLPEWDFLLHIGFQHEET
ncbi:zinc finger protein 184 [Folsomia candida]|uniref:zinc finger protein 184 n=1 Tax=Folsomia candida TaxID=158441 RepID=UPI0016051FC5|nr:zinc finger protein 184 [Folsomia candida]